jgi:hypothetical protein
MEPTDQEIIDYLFGDLAEPHQVQVEDLLFSSEDFLERLSGIETRLVDLYAMDKLSPSERKLFEEKYLISPRRNANVTASTEFIRLLDSHRSRQQPSLVERLRSRLRSFFGSNNFAIQVALASLAFVFSVGFVWLLTERGRLQSQSEALQAGLRQKEADLQAQASNQDRVTTERAALERERAELNQAEQSLKQKEAELRALEASARPRFATFVLSATVRSGLGSPELEIRPYHRSVRLVANLEGQLAERYRVSLKRASGEVVWKKIVPRSNQRKLTVDVPASYFTDRNYIVEVEGLAPDETPLSSKGYSLTVKGVN